MYAKEKLGIAIKTNTESLRSCFDEVSENIHIGEVRYYDDAPFYKLGNIYFPFLTKNKYYEFESEVRCITELHPNDNSTSKNIKVNLNELIQEVYISPFAEQCGMIEIINSLRVKNNLNFNIRVSGVNDTWI